MSSTWVDPRYEATASFFTTTRRKVASQGLKPCKACRGLRHKFLIEPDTRKPYKIPCLACSPGA